MTRPSQKTLLIVAFGCIYFFWGSTYGAIRIAGEHIAPPLVGATRSLLSTALIIAICAARGVSLRVSRHTAWRLALVGILFMTVNNVLLVWAETIVPSGYAALVIAMIPIFVALIESVLPGGETLNLRGWLGTLLAGVGMFALIWPTLHRARGPLTGVGQTSANRVVLAFVVLVVAALAFAVGSVLARRFHFTTDTFVATAWQIGCAGILNLGIAVAGGNFRTAHWTGSGIAAIVYLSTFGSIVGLSAYTYLLKHVPVTKVSTYAFVNPVVAVILGAVTLHERPPAPELTAMLIIIAAVAIVIQSRTRPTVPPRTAYK
jgi:drug/metabolite transporter (DMT)-like permease